MSPSIVVRAFLFGLALDLVAKLVVLFVPLGMLVNTAARRPEKMQSAVFDLMRAMFVMRMGHLACP
jgi:hypothetical protein